MATQLVPLHPNTSADLDPAKRRRALAAADASNRIEGFERSAETAPLFEQWVRGVLTNDDLRAALRAHYASQR